MKRYILIIIIILLYGCKKKTTSPDNPPTITSFLPSVTQLVKHIGDVIDFTLWASDSDEEGISYKFIKDDIEVGSNSEYSWTVDNLGMTEILGIAYNELADTVRWSISVENTAPIISEMLDVSGNEDEILIGSIVNQPQFYDNEDVSEDLTLQLTQTNSELIKFVLNDEYRIIN